MRIEKLRKIALGECPMKKIIIASDHGSVALKNEIISFLKAKNCAVKDMGVNSEDSVDYPDIAVAACNEFKKGGYHFGILLCGTGIGMSIVANKIKGIRCAQVFDLFTAEMAKAHNNANFIAFGGRIKYSVPVTEMIDTFMNTNFAGERHERRVAKIMDVEKQC
jgi:ribose 5-phosphate isomerase B